MDTEHPFTEAPDTEGAVVLMPERNPVGRPSKYRPEFCEAIIEHAATGASLVSFAGSIRVAKATLNNWAADIPEFSEAMQTAKAIAAHWWEERMRRIADGGGGPGAATVTIFALKNFAGEDWQDKSTHEHTGRITHAPLTYEEAIEEAARRGLPRSVLDE
jgi:transposase